MQRSPLDPAHWPNLDRLLDAALDLPVEQREQFIAALDVQFEALKPHLRDLLSRAAHVETRDFLAALPKLECDPPGAASTGRAGECVGPYRLVRELGAGGMGAVWLAERMDGLIKRPVALKLPHVASRHVALAERMAREREILATLSHPNIARLYDAGVTEHGQPYLALEFIDGERIDLYCKQRALSLEQRIELFLKVAAAVAYAHAQLVLHRDLKPANILVSTDGEPHLLDFGVAKLISDERVGRSPLTEFSGRALTPDYASPEQIAGQTLTIAADIYALGVLLYELLTGARPYRLKRDSRGALEEAILESEPRRPSESVAEPRLGRALRGELDTITLHALRKLPGERYPTVEAFAEDLRRYRAGLPVLAQPDSRWYRARKFIARHRGGVAAVVVVAALLVAAAGVSLWQARTALVQQQRAEQIQIFMTSLFRDADPYGRTGRALTAAELLSAAQGAIAERFADQPDLRVELMRIIGGSQASLGDFANAEKSLHAATVEASRWFGAEHHESLHAQLLLAEVHNSQRKLEEVRGAIARLTPNVRAAAERTPELLVRLLKLQANLAYEEGRYGDVEAPAREAMERAVRELGPTHALSVGASSLLAESYVTGGREHGAMLAETQRALEFAQRAHPGDDDHPAVLRMRDVHGRALAVAGRYREAVVHLQAAIDGSARALGEDSLQTAFARVNVAPYYRRLGDLERSLANTDIGLAILAKHIAPESADYAFALTTRGVTLIAARRHVDALANLSEAEQTYRALFGPDHWDTLTAQFNRAVALAYLGRFREAHGALAPARRSNVKFESPMWVSHVQGVVARLSGDAAAAIEHQNQAEAHIAPGARAPWDLMRVLAERGLAERDAGAPQSHATLLRARALFEQLDVQMHPAYAEVLAALDQTTAAKRVVAR